MLTFEVLGRPGPKGSRTVGKTKKGGTFTRPASKFEKPWEKCVSVAAAEQAAAHGTLEPPYGVTLFFVRARPKRPVWAWPSREDVDKLTRCTLDGLKVGGLIVDDRHVIRLTVDEAYAESGEEGCLVSIGTVAPSCYIPALGVDSTPPPTQFG